MAIRERMIYAIDLVTDGANKGLASFRTRLNEAGTASGKFKVGASEAMNQVKAHAATLAMAGGAALVTFGAKAVQSFQDGALEAGKFAQATGLSNEEASRWVEIAGDIGIESSNLESAFGRFNKELGESPERIAALGVEVVKTKDGLVDANSTLANAIGRLGEIKDPTERAAVAQELFGRSWQNMAELVGMSAGELKRELASVADAQVFDDEEVAKARELRAAWDDLSDKLNGFVLFVGGELVPRLAEAAETISNVVDAVRPLGEAIGDARDAASGFLDKLGPVGDGVKRVGEYLIPLHGQMKLLNDGMNAFSDDVAGSVVGSFEDITGAVEDDTAAIEENTAKIGGPGAAAQKAYEESLLDAAAASRESKKATEEQSLALDEAISKRQEDIDAWRAWRDSINSSTDSAEASLGDFVESAETSFEEWRDELAKSIIAQAEWKNNLAQIGAETSAEFAAALAEMGMAGAGLVQEIANDSSKMDEAFGLWSESANQAGRDLVGEIESIKSEASSSATAVGRAISDGMAAGIDAAAANVGARAAAAARNALTAAREAMKIASPSQVMADEVGAPIAEGIAEGIEDRAADITDAIEDALDAALDAAEDKVDAAKDRLSDVLGGISDRNSLEDAREAVSDQERALEQARAGGDAEDISDAERALRRDNERLLRILIEQNGGRLSNDMLGVARAAGWSEADITAFRVASTYTRNAEAAAAATAGAVNNYRIEVQTLTGQLSEAAIQQLIAILDEVERRRRAGG